MSLLTELCDFCDKIPQRFQTHRLSTLHDLRFYLRPVCGHDAISDGRFAIFGRNLFWIEAVSLVCLGTFYGTAS
jgi:hypothetical protein